MKTTAIRVLICAHLLTAHQATAQHMRDLAYYRDLTRQVLANCAEMFEPAMLEDERDVARTVVVKIPLSDGVGAFAFLDGDKRRIDVYAGMPQVLEWIASAAILETRFERRGCLKGYANDLFQTIADNSSGSKPRPFSDPFRFGGRCAGVHPERFAQTAAGTEFAGMMNASMAMLYLHEMAHHALRHVDDGGRTPKISRTQEAAADAWAVETAARANFTLAAAYPLLTLMAGLGGNSFEDEVKSTHPLGIRRARDILKAARANLSDRKARAEIDEMLEEVESLFEQVDN